ncbi:MAG: hypothetical protein H6686_07745 [Fibrobacteria bacterium]|nr:hypothetical protein [Fibrobacteria bacterium]
MISRCLSLAALLLALPSVSEAQDDGFEPAKKNVVYGHPGQVSAMVAVASVPGDIGVIWLQADYERFLQPGLSGIGGIQYMNFYPTSSGDDGNFGIIDVLGGIRWYTNRKFSGFYLQPQLNYNRIFVNVDDSQEEWGLVANRFGLSAVLGVNGKWDAISVDWNVGFYYLSSPTTTVKKTDKVTGSVQEMDISDETDEVAKILLSSLMPTSSFSIGLPF